MIRDLLFPIIYGLVIFLAGMKVMEAALSRLAGPCYPEACIRPHLRQ